MREQERDGVEKGQERERDVKRQRETNRERTLKKKKKKKKKKLVGWYIEPSQPQSITSGLEKKRKKRSQ